MPAVDAPALSPLAPLGDVAGRYPKHAVEVIATGDPDRACLRVDDPPHHRVMLVDVPRGLVLAEDSLRQVPAPPPAGVRLGDPRWRVRTCNYGPDGDVRWLLAWIDPASARVLATVDRPHHAFDDDVVVRDDEVVLIGNTWHARDGGRLVAQGPAAKAMDDEALAPALDRARGLVWFAVARDRGWASYVTLVRARVADGVLARRKLELPYAHRIIPSDDGGTVWVVHHETAVRVRAKDLAVLDTHALPPEHELMACARDGSALVLYDFERAKVVTVGAPLAPDAPWTGVGDHVARDGSHGFVLRDQVLWRVDLRTGRRESFQVGHGRRVEAVAYAPRGDRLASVATDGAALVWRLDDATPDAALESAPDARGVVFTADGRGLLVLSAERSLRGGLTVDVATRWHAFDLAAGAERAQVELATPSSDLVVSPDGAWVTPSFGCGGDSFGWFDVAGGVMRTAPLPRHAPPPEATSVADDPPLHGGLPPDRDEAPPWCAGFSPDGALVVLHTLGGGAYPQRVARTEIDPAAGVVRASRVLGRPVTLARGTRLSSDCAGLALRLHERIVVVDLATERSLWHVDVRRGGGWSLWGGVTRLGHAVLTYRDEWGGLTVARLDRKALRRVEPPGAEITALALSADEREVAAGLADGRVLRWRIGDG